jgi:hypothetical protein
VDVVQLVLLYRDFKTCSARKLSETVRICGTSKFPETSGTLKRLPEKSSGTSRDVWRLQIGRKKDFPETFETFTDFKRLPSNYQTCKPTLSETAIRMQMSLVQLRIAARSAIKLRQSLS